MNQFLVYFLFFVHLAWSAIPYSEVTLYPLNNASTLSSDYWIEWNLQGHTESEIQSGIQRNFYYVSPKLIESDNTSSNSLYSGKWLGKRNILIIQDHSTNYTLVIGYQYLQGVRVERFKNTYYKKRLIDQVNFFYQNTELIATWSSLYGLKYFKSNHSFYTKTVNTITWIWARLNTY